MKKALIVEDHLDMLDVLSRQLEMLEFTVIAVDNGMEGASQSTTEWKVWRKPSQKNPI
jgi:CheY-like chemotaxis protein